MDRSLPSPSLNRSTGAHPPLDAVRAVHGLPTSGTSMSWRCSAAPILFWLEPGSRKPCLTAHVDNQDLALERPLKKGGAQQVDT